MIQSKTSIATQHLLGGNFVKAFSILKTFKLGLIPVEIRVLVITAESLTGKRSFYEALDVDVDAVCVMACEIVNNRWLNNEPSKLVFSNSNFSLIKSNSNEVISN